MVLSGLGLGVTLSPSREPVGGQAIGVMAPGKPSRRGTVSMGRSTGDVASMYADDTGLALSAMEQVGPILSKSNFQDQF